MMFYVPLAAVEEEGQQGHGDGDGDERGAAAAGASRQPVALRVEEGKDSVKERGQSGSGCWVVLIQALL